MFCEKIHKALSFSKIERKMRYTADTFLLEQHRTTSVCFMYKIRIKRRLQYVGYYRF